MFIQGSHGDLAALPTASDETIAELVDHITDELLHLPVMRGGGPTGTFYEHLRPNVDQVHQASLLARVLSMLPSSEAPTEALRIHRSAKISTPFKPAMPARSRGIRPIGGGSAHWRVAFRGWVKMFGEEVKEACGSTQYGVKTSGACATLRSDLALDWALHPNRALLGVDLKNMHGRTKTRHLEQQVRHRTPRML